jgi:hypothetical protein
MTIFYVLGESENDRAALVHLISARGQVKKKSIRAIPLREPLIQQKNATKATSTSNSKKVQNAVKARMRINNERNIVIVAHEDCDAVEPAHTHVSNRIRAGLSDIGFPIVAAAPAFEMEAWWYLWPDAVQEVCKSWKPLNPRGRNVGLINDAKRQITRDLRPNNHGNVREYCEADSVSIARKVKEMGILDKRAGTSASFDQFDVEILAHL